MANQLLNYQLLGILGAVLLCLAFLPQCWHLLKTKDLNYINKKPLVLLVIGSILWIAYGFRDSSPAIVLLATFGFTAASMLLAIKLRSNKTS